LSTGEIVSVRRKTNGKQVQNSAGATVPDRKTVQLRLAEMSSAKILQVKVKPRARVSSLEESSDGGLWLARLKSPPVDGKANQELIALVARHFGCRKSAVSIKTGASGRTKLVRIED
jgi:uncharacterized protein (TIGR00251 family)